MSCLPGTPCYTSTIHTSGGISGGCNIDPCITIKLGTDSVIYTGPTLPCSGINPCDTVTLALQKIDAIICNPPALSVTADNGLTKTANNIQLGGPLIQQTVITTSFANTLSLLGLVSDNNPAFIITQTSAGVLKKSTVASILAGITADNGLTKTGNNIQLGGPLIKATTVTTDPVNTLSLAGLVTSSSPNFIISETGGVITKTSYGSLLPITADNGLTKTGNNIQLGGTLIKNTTIDLQTFSLVLSENNGTIYSTNTFNSSSSILQTGDDPVATPTGSFTRTITFKSSAATWLTNYASSAYNAQANWEAAHPWVTMDAAHRFQVVDHIHAVNKNSAFVGRYYDERVNNSNWDETWGSSSAPGWPGWVNGNVYTLRTLETGDVFQAGMASSTIQGTPGTAGWVFTSNGTAPTTWTNGSLVDGDFPVIDFADISAMVITKDLSGYGQVNTRANSLLGEHKYMSLGSNSLPTQDYGMAIGKDNTVGGMYSFSAGFDNSVSGQSSYIIGETNEVSSDYSGALGNLNTVDGTYCHAIGFYLTIPSANTATLQVGQYNNTAAVDYNFEFSKASYPVFSVANGKRIGLNPIDKLNVFHVMAGGIVKSKDGYDSRAGERGILPPQWSDTGWVDVSGQTFDAGAKYIITQYEIGDDFSNLIDRILWGESNTTGFTFIAGPGTNPTNWGNGSQVTKVGRPISPEPGEMGYNLDLAKMEYYNGTTWIQF